MTSIAGVQFVLIGDDPGAKPVLVDLELVKGDNRVRPLDFIHHFGVMIDLEYC